MTDEVVLSRSFDKNRAEVEGWLKDRTIGVVAPEAVEFCVCSALRHGKLDAYRAGLCLQVTFQWPVDFDLVRVLHAIVSSAPEVLRDETANWVIRTGHRPPCVEGDQIEWLSPGGEPRAGVVVAISSATGRIYAKLGADPDAEDPTVRLFTEQVYANVTQGRYEVEHPPVGLRYINAPALAAQAEAERIRDRHPAPAAKPAYAPSGDGPRAA